MGVTARQHLSNLLSCWQLRLSKQLQQAHDALDHAFTPRRTTRSKLLFWLPVTKPWLRQLVLGLTLIGHSSVRGVTELLDDLFDYPLSPGTVHNILDQAVGSARRHNLRRDLTPVRLGALDEIFQAGQALAYRHPLLAAFLTRLTRSSYPDRTRPA